MNEIQGSFHSATSLNSPTPINLSRFLLSWFTGSKIALSKVKTLYNALTNSNAGWVSCKWDPGKLKKYIIMVKYINEWMDEWMNEWMDEWMNEWMDGWMNEWMTEWLNDWTTEWTNAEWMNAWMN